MSNMCWASLLSCWCLSILSWQCRPFRAFDLCKAGRGLCIFLSSYRKRALCSSKHPGTQQVCGWVCPEGSTADTTARPSSQKREEVALKPAMAPCSFKGRLKFSMDSNCSQSGQVKVRKADRDEREPLPLPCIIWRKFPKTIQVVWRCHGAK